ncbi:MAG TPA: methyltransferase domain-containing protein [Bryobacteraceae bacterium]|nr:methyltransferase domain-containing protein [Bryobacteraceae bacterium]
MQSEKPFLDVQEVVNEIRARVRGRIAAQPVSRAVPEIEAVATQVSSLDLSRLHESARRVRAAQALVGQMPPQPPGLRARLGAAMVAAVRRMLFWYTPQIQQFHYAAAQAIEEQESAASELTRELASLSQSLQSLQRSVSGLEREIAQLRTSAKQETQEIIKPVRTELSALEVQLRTDLENAIAASDERITRVEAAVASGSVSPEARIKDIQRRMDEAIGFTGDRLADLRTKLNLQSRQIAALLEGSRVNECPHGDERDLRGIDSLYAKFEDVFRGAREDIKERVRVYVPVLSEAGIGGPDMPVLDIGCGRGEWLELLNENGIQARGVDANRAMVARCELLGLPVAEADGIDYLKSLPADSLGAVTVFHVVEHLQFEQLLDLLDEAARVLKPGGVAIFETPNPGNVLVGASNFYTDPTHRNPLPQRLLQFLAEARGFSRVDTMALHPYPNDVLFPGDAGAVGERLNDLLYGPQDYAIIARR